MQVQQMQTCKFKQQVDVATLVVLMQRLLMKQVRRRVTGLNGASCKKFLKHGGAVLHGIENARIPAMTKVLNTTKDLSSVIRRKAVDQQEVDKFRADIHEYFAIISNTFPQDIGYGSYDLGLLELHSKMVKHLQAKEAMARNEPHVCIEDLLPPCHHDETPLEAGIQFAKADIRNNTEKVAIDHECLPLLKRGIITCSQLLREKPKVSDGERKEDTCRRCGAVGHRKTNPDCPMREPGEDGPDYSRTVPEVGYVTTQNPGTALPLSRILLHNNFMDRLWKARKKEHYEMHFALNRNFMTLWTKFSNHTTKTDFSYCDYTATLNIVPEWGKVSMELTLKLCPCVKLSFVTVLKQYVKCMDRVNLACRSMGSSTPLCIPAHWYPKKRKARKRKAPAAPPAAPAPPA